MSQCTCPQIVHGICDHRGAAHHTFMAPDDFCLVKHTYRVWGRCVQQTCCRLVGPWSRSTVRKSLKPWKLGVMEWVASSVVAAVREWK